MGMAKKGIAGLVLGAVGIVFGDIGTSPLYAIQAVFSPIGQHLEASQDNVYGIISLVIWSVIMVVSLKYIAFVMHADNKGEGGIIALVAMVKSTTLGVRSKWFFIFLGLIGIALFYGDSAITPAISVLSAVEGLKVVNPDLASFVLPLTFGILTFLFVIQRFGTKMIGRMFGPVMTVWFITIALGGLWQIMQHPNILIALSPLSAMEFFINQPGVAFIAMGAVVLSVTGAEALYADMGHFGRAPIARAWFWLVFPALALCYMGQGALLIISPDSATSSFILLFPEGVQIPVIILATLATLIASQSVISGAFSLTRQAIHLNFLPKMLVKHTSEREVGQIYLPFINGALFVAVILLVLVFGSSAKLANAYGIAVSGTLAIDTILFMVVARSLWRKSFGYVALFALAFLSLDLLFVTANLSKVLHGGLFPLIFAGLVFLVIHTWIKGQKIVSEERGKMEAPLDDFVEFIRMTKPPITRVPGYAVYISHHPGLTPLALHSTVEELHELHEKVVIVSVDITNEARVSQDERAKFDSLGYDDGISYLSLSFGFSDTPDIPKTLESLRHLSPELDFDPAHVSYFISLSKVVPTNRHNLALWRKTLYAVMARNALSQSDYYRLPTNRTVEMRTLIEV